MTLSSQARLFSCRAGNVVKTWWKRACLPALDTCRDAHAVTVRRTKTLAPEPFPPLSIHYVLIYHSPSRDWFAIGGRAGCLRLSRGTWPACGRPDRRAFLRSRIRSGKRDVDSTQASRPTGRGGWLAKQPAAWARPGSGRPALSSETNRRWARDKKGTDAWLLLFAVVLAMGCQLASASSALPPPAPSRHLHIPHHIWRVNHARGSIGKGGQGANTSSLATAVGDHPRPPTAALGGEPREAAGPQFANSFTSHPLPPHLASLAVRPGLGRRPALCV